jgi:DNA-binding MarR family transcriptional regulator
MARPSRLQQEIKQTRPFRSLGQEAMVGLLRTADVVRRRAGRALAGADLTLQQYNVLRVLRGAGPSGLPTLEITERLIEQAPGITRLLDRLEAKRLVLRERTPRDRRQVTCRISETGLRLLARLDPGVNAADDTMLRPLSVPQQRQLIRLLERVRSGGDGA